MFYEKLQTKIRNLGYGGNHCLDVPDNTQQAMIVYTCHGQGSHQYFVYEDGIIKRDNFFVAYADPTIQFTVYSLGDNKVSSNLKLPIKSTDTDFCLEMDLQKSNEAILQRRCQSMPRN